MTDGSDAWPNYGEYLTAFREAQEKAIAETKALAGLVADTGMVDVVREYDGLPIQAGMFDKLYAKFPHLRTNDIDLLVVGVLQGRKRLASAQDEVARNLSGCLRTVGISEAKRAADKVRSKEVDTPRDVGTLFAASKFRKMILDGGAVTEKTVPYIRAYCETLAAEFGIALEGNPEDSYEMLDTMVPSPAPGI